VRRLLTLLAGFVILLVLPGCGLFGDNRVVPHQYRFGIYWLCPASGDIGLFYSSSGRMSNLDLNRAGTRFVFAHRIGGDELADEEICLVDTDARWLHRLTDNDFLDTYPVFAPDGHRIVYLSWPDSTLDIWLMDSGGVPGLLYDSGSHDGDPSWFGSRIAFTTGSRVWLMNDDGTNPVQVTDPPRAGEWGNAVLPFGDYDPRFSPDGSCIVFERLVDDQTIHGNYDLFAINPDGTNETRLTTTGWTQGMANWSPDGTELVFLVSAVGTEGRYDIWLMDADGSNRRDITPEYVPDDFLCHCPLFDASGDTVWFIGEWWE
jgi:Tol biopolymer transport system component